MRERLHKTVYTFQNLPDVNGSIYSVISDGNGGVFIGGSIQGFQSQGQYLTRQCAVAHILSNGSLDAAWNPNVKQEFGSFIQEGVVYSLALYNGRLYIAGRFTSVNGAERFQLAALDAATGALSSWNANNMQTTTSYPNIQNMVFNMQVLPHNGAVFGAGTFFMPDERGYVGKFDASSGLLTSWGNKVTSPLGFYVPKITALSVSNGVLYVGGQFMEIAGANRRNLAAFDLSTGDILPWNPGATMQWDWAVGTITALVAQNGQIYMSGSFSSIGGQIRQNLGAVDVNGSLTSWNPAPHNGNVANLRNGQKISN